MKKQIKKIVDKNPNLFFQKSKVFYNKSLEKKPIFSYLSNQNQHDDDTPKELPHKLKKDQKITITLEDNS